MTLKYVLVVNSDVNSQGAYSAYLFARALLKQGHQLTQVFFYQQGTANTNALYCPASDETNVVALWQGLAENFAVDLVSCVAASLRRGIVDEQLAKEQQLASDNLAPHFRLGGLGEFVQASADADKLIQF
ncbi:sulfurtransferase complex subunit TusD [Psychrobium sp. 1_MG-2023]|uniref:sulfurtransferase complex subunit TusD n=1 Tax=Psychrobium sp. 1_MG-2023 TaxID=3062624 RepID=UPI000C340CBF|nr:sulfurtransferase complex subunit TusD [Psychrobium sp. 1_MG-2023]MDP2562975.1 sulfurtransferase complex subunit TusD [Psychrobium sp. 1_MG-2023]PKF59725.1 sulfurtransferase complex subunit TusD [Alteromonadales bacterium alter-6D02]